MPIAPRRAASTTRFASRNRRSLALVAALEQVSGLLVHPVLVVTLCALLTSDLTRMVGPAVAATLAWICGYAVAPLALAAARRRLPWAIGAAIVRTASLALLAYVLASEGVDREQRLRSILICLVAYGVSAGLARGVSEALAIQTTSAPRVTYTQPLLALIPAALATIAGIGAFTLLVDVPRSPLSRLATLVTVAAVFSAAAVLFLGRVVESPGRSPTAAYQPPSAGWRKQLPAIAWMSLAAAATATELLLIVGLSRSMELPRAYLMSGAGVFIAATALTALLATALGPALPLSALIHTATLLSAVAFALAVGLPTLVDLGQVPDTFLGRRPAEVGVWAVMALLGVAQQIRRRVLPRLTAEAFIPSRLVNIVGVALAASPLAVAALLEAWRPERWLVLGLAVSLVGVIAGGLVAPNHRRAPVRRSPVTAPYGPPVRALDRRLTS